MSGEAQPLTLAQARWLRALCELTEQHGYPPTLREWCAACRRNIASTYEMVARLERAGYVRQDERVCRGTVPLRWPDGVAFDEPRWPERLTTVGGTRLSRVEIVR